MADYHFHVQRVKRSAGKSVVAAAAYRAGEKLKDDYYGLIHDYSQKEVIKSGIFLPGHAPPRLQDRETLWNEVEKVEKHPAAQLAYQLLITIPALGDGILSAIFGAFGVLGEAGIAQVNEYPV